MTFSDETTQRVQTWLGVGPYIAHEYPPLIDASIGAILRRLIDEADHDITAYDLVLDWLGEQLHEVDRPDLLKTLVLAVDSWLKSKVEPQP